MNGKLPSIASLPRQSAYEIIEPIDRGSWTAVYLAKRKVDGSLWALKFLDPTPVAQKQMAERNLTIDDVWKKEGLSGYNKGHTNLARNIIEVADDGTKFLAEEYIEEFLPAWLGAHPEPKLEDILRIATGTAAGLAALHREMGRVHSDLKIDNIGYERDTIKISDFGASTVLDSSVGARRDNIGDIGVRAPECFKEGSCPTKRSDVWAFGSLLYRLFTGEYVFEPELKNAKDPSAYMKGLDGKVADTMVAQKLKRSEIPKPIRKFLRKALAHEQYSRFYGADDMQTSLSKAVDALDTWKGFRQMAVKYALMPLAGAALFGMAIYKSATADPRELTMPKTVVIGPPFDTEIVDKGQVEFEWEWFLGLPSVSDRSKEDDWSSRNISRNRNVAFLFKAYLQASREVGNDIRGVTQGQMDLGYEIGGNGMNIRYHEDMVARCIERAMVLSHDPSYPDRVAVDGDDVLAIARLGLPMFEQARRAAKSFDFKEYLHAKDIDGKPIIPEEERRFLLTWRAYIEKGRGPYVTSSDSPYGQDLMSIYDESISEPERRELLKRWDSNRPAPDGRSP